MTWTFFFPCLARGRRAAAGARERGRSTLDRLSRVCIHCVCMIITFSFALIGENSVRLVPLVRPSLLPPSPPSLQQPRPSSPPLPSIAIVVKPHNSAAPWASDLLALGSDFSRCSKKTIVPLRR